MIQTIAFLLLSGLTLSLTACGDSGKQGNNTNSARPGKLVGGGCDGCELMYTGMPEEIRSVDTNADWYEPGQRLEVSGTVFKKDGTTPAPGIIVYYYHTDQTGHYSKRPDRAASQTKHGHIRGWVKTDATGHYAIYTARPAPYPNNSIPAHIHIVVKEPNINEYYIDELVFDDDPLLTEAKRKSLENRGSSGIIKVLRNGNLQIVRHNIILGLNIPDYPGTK